eukprot:6205587-Pleurochrysis_carterae.AAC.1
MINQPGHFRPKQAHAQVWIESRLCSKPVRTLSDLNEILPDLVVTSWLRFFVDTVIRATEIDK